MAGHSEYVKLNVGGTQFVTSKKTLLSNAFSGPSHYFSGLTSGEIVAETDSDGHIIVDRSPEKFRVILEYLRTGIMEVPNGMTTSSLIVEADFFGWREAIEMALMTGTIPKRIPAVAHLRFGGHYCRFNATKENMAVSLSLHGMDHECLESKPMQKNLKQAKDSFDWGTYEMSDDLVELNFEKKEKPLYAHVLDGGLRLILLGGSGAISELLDFHDS